MSRILVAGLGNVLMGDDAIGLHCLAWLRARYEFPEDVDLVDVGTPGLDLLLHVSIAQAVIAVDALRGMEPGIVRRFAGESLRRPTGPRLDTHAPALQEAIAYTDFVRGRSLDAVLVGMGGARFDQTTTLSAVVREGLSRLVDATLKEIALRGVAGRPRDSADVPDIWWEKRASGQLCS